MRFPIVLSIDIDYFVTPIAYYRNSNERRSDDECSVKSEESVRNFIEQHCHLTREARTRGHVITDHDEAFDKLKDAFEEGWLSPPVDLYHVDAHSDETASGAGECEYVLCELIHKPLSERTTVRRGHEGLCNANWVTFCVANRWIHSIEFLPHEDYRCELCWFYFHTSQTEKTGTGLMELVPIKKNAKFFEWTTSDAQRESLLRKRRGTEPAVAWSTVVEDQFRLPERPDYVLVCQSPGYTPSTADRLLEIISEYIELDK